MNFSESIW